MATAPLKSNKHYTFNPDNQKYIFHTEKKFGKNRVHTKQVIDNIVKLYSNITGGLTANEIALKLAIPADEVRHILKVMQITHETIPFTDEKVQESSEDSLVDDALSAKKYNILQKIERQDWKNTTDDAEKWRQFKHLTLDPFSLFLQNWTPPAIPQTPKSVNLTSKTSDKVFVAVLSDLHFGSAANGLYTFKGKSWTTKDTVNAVDQYSKEIVKEVGERNYKFKKCVIIGLGDLIHSVLGKTARGTELKFDVIREEQFDYAMNSLLIFIQRMVDIFGKVECHDVGGNHHYELDMVLFRALHMYFMKDSRVAFTHYSTRPAAFKIDRTLIMIDHGADSVERVYVPNGGKVERHVNSILLNNPKLLENVDTKLFIQGDKHHFEHLEFSTFEYIMFGTILGADEHSSTNNWHNRARQSCMILDSKGLREILHFYFD